MNFHLSQKENLEQVLFLSHLKGPGLLGNPPPSTFLRKASSLQSVGSLGSLDSTTMKTLGAFSQSQGTMKIPDGWADATLFNNTGLNVVGDTIKAEVMNEMNATS